MSSLKELLELKTDINKAKASSITRDHTKIMKDIEVKMAKQALEEALVSVDLESFVSATLKSLNIDMKIFRKLNNLSNNWTPNTKMAYSSRRKIMKDMLNIIYDNHQLVKEICYTVDCSRNQNASNDEHDFDDMDNLSPVGEKKFIARELTMKEALEELAHAKVITKLTIKQMDIEAKYDEKIKKNRGIFNDDSDEEYETDRKNTPSEQQKIDKKESELIKKKQNELTKIKKSLMKEGRRLVANSSNGEVINQLKHTLIIKKNKN